MDLITIDGKSYLCATSLSEKFPSFFLGAKTRYIRRIVEKKNIPSDAHIYAVKQGNTWISSTSTYKRAKLFLEQQWVRKHIQKEEKNGLVEGEKYQPCPPIIFLLETDRFRNDAGELFEVKMVGEKTEGGCFFRVADVSVAFQMPNLVSSILHASGGYARGKDFRTFDCSNHHREEIVHSMSNTIQLFLTYEGLLKVLYSSRSGSAQKFRQWCSSILFRSTFGTVDEKQQAAEDILVLPSKTLRNVLSKSATDIPVIYLFKVYPNNSQSFFYKFGCSANFKRRAEELKRKFRDMNLYDELELFSYIDPKYIFQAETALKSSLTTVGTLVKVENCSDMEFVNFSADKSNFVRDQFRMISRQFAGQTAELQKDIEVMKERHEYEVRLLKKELELQEKEIEILRLRLQLAERVA